MTASPKPIAAAPALTRAQQATLKAGKCPCRHHDAFRDGLCVICLLRRVQGQPSGAAWAALSEEDHADLAAWMFNNPLTRLSGGTERDGAAREEVAV